MKNVIISGANGFIGRNTVRYFSDSKINILALTSRINSKYLLESEFVEYREFDIFNINTFEESIEKDKYDTFIHLAWQGSSGEQRSDYHLQLDNVRAVVECMELAKRIGCKKFICAGSIMEYEAKEAIEKGVNVPSGPYIYGVAKSTAHSICKIQASIIGIDLIWCLITNAYGVGEESARFINSTLNKIINNERLTFTSGSQNYDFIYIDDVARAIFHISKYGKSFSEYVIGSGNPRPLREFIEMIVSEINPLISCEFGAIPFKGENLALERFDTSTLRLDNDFQCEYTFAKGIRKTFDWLKSRGVE